MLIFMLVNVSACPLPVQYVLPGMKLCLRHGSERTFLHCKAMARIIPL